MKKAIQIFAAIVLGFLETVLIGKIGTKYDIPGLVAGEIMHVTGIVILPICVWLTYAILGNTPVFREEKKTPNQPPVPTRGNGT